MTRVGRNCDLTSIVEGGQAPPGFEPGMADLQSAAGQTEPSMLPSTFDKDLVRRDRALTKPNAETDADLAGVLALPGRADQGRDPGLSRHRDELDMKRSGPADALRSSRPATFQGYLWCLRPWPAGARSGAGAGTGSSGSSAVHNLPALINSLFPAYSLVIADLG